MRAGIISIVIGYAGMLIFGLALPTSLGMTKFYVLMIFNGFALGGQALTYLILTVSLANTIEYNEWKKGAREEGIIYSLRPLMAKFGSAMVQLLNMIIFIAVGVFAFTNEIARYEQNADRALAGVTDPAIRQEIEDAKIAGIENIINSIGGGQRIALLLCLTLIPLTLLVTTFILYRKKYKINEDMYKNMLKEIAERKKETAANES
jgi:melibiose permease/lactose/raffinose/galactose permease